MNKQHSKRKESYVSPEFFVLELASEESILVGSNEGFGEQDGVMMLDNNSVEFLSL